MGLTRDERQVLQAYRNKKSETGGTDFLFRVVLVQPATKERSFDPAGNIPCHVDTTCKWTGKSLARSKVHATRDTLQIEGHLPK